MARAVGVTSLNVVGSRCIGWVDKHGNTTGRGDQLTQKFQPLCRQFPGEEIDTGQAAARTREAGDKTKPDRVFVDVEDDRDRRACLGCQRSGVSDGDEHGDLSARHFSHQLRQSIDLILRPAIYSGDVLALDIAGVFEALTESAQAVRERVRCGVEKSDHWHRRLLPARRERPSRRCAAEQRDELASS
jgi:hypothetical protein